MKPGPTRWLNLLDASGRRVGGALGGGVCAYVTGWWLWNAAVRWHFPLGLVMQCGVLMSAAWMTIGVMRPRRFVLFCLPLLNALAESGDAANHWGPSTVSTHRAFVIHLLLWLALPAVTLGGLLQWWPVLALGTVLFGGFAWQAPRAFPPAPLPSDAPPQLPR